MKQQSAAPKVKGQVRNTGVAKKTSAFFVSKDARNLRLKPGEEVLHIHVNLHVNKNDGLNNRDIDMTVWFPDDPKLLAAVLLQSWQLCLGSKSPAADFLREVISQGWVQSRDVIAEAKKYNRGGRPPGTGKPEIRKFKSIFREKKKHSGLSDQAIIASLAEEAVKAKNRRVTDAKLKTESSRIKRALQRDGLLPVKHRKSKRN
jgi:hypothetical protein